MVSLCHLADFKTQTFESFFCCMRESFRLKQQLAIADFEQQVAVQKKEKK